MKKVELLPNGDCDTGYNPDILIPVSSIFSNCINPDISGRWKIHQQQ